MDIANFAGAVSQLSLGKDLILTEETNKHIQN